ncbi:MAG TPA: CoA-binding protein, partial [Longimicrobiaceae bacterium]|nr:CoA-binding protein [Longimicrobiaceae bacterium]
MSDDDQLPLEILRSARTIAVLGMKGDDEPMAPASAVPQYLAAHGYTVIPVNPELAEAGHPGAVSTLEELEEAPDVVEVFRNAENVAEHADELLALRPKAVWLQLGIRNDEVARRLEEAGIRVVQDRCMKIEHHRLAA